MTAKTPSLRGWHPGPASRGRFSWLAKLKDLSPILYAVVPVYIAHSLQASFEKARQLANIAEVTSSRETSEMTFRGAVFGPLLDKILDRKRNIHERVAILKVFESNFCTAFDSSPLFYLLEEELRSKPSPNMEQDLYDLYATTRGITAVEQDIIAASAGKMRSELLDTTVALAVGESLTVTRGMYTSADIASHRHEIRLKRLTNAGDQPRVFLRIEPVEHDPHGDVMSLADTIWVSPFDTPFTDNKLFPNGHRVAVVVRSSPGEWDLDAPMRFAVLHFPADLIVGTYRPSTSAMRRILEDVKQSEQSDAWWKTPKKWFSAAAGHSSHAGH